MAEVDSSIYNKLVQPNPLGVAKDVVDYQNATLQNQTMQMDVQARQQMGRAVQEATDPATGQVDQAKLSEILRRPENYAAAAAGAKFGVELKGEQAGAESAGIDVNQKAFQNLGTVWGARIARSPGDVDPKTLRQDVYDLWARGGLGTDAKRVLEIIRQIPDDPKAARAYAAGGFLQALGASGIAAPAEATPGPGGETRRQTAGQFVTQSLDGGEAAAGGVAPAASGGGIRTSPTLAEAQALPQIGLSSAHAWVSLGKQAAQVNDRKGALDNMLADSAEFDGGPVSEELKTFIAGANELFGTKFDVERVAAQERFDKLANTMALAQSNEMGITDLTTQTAMGANPNSRMSNLGREGVIALLKGNEDAIAVRAEMGQDALDEKKYTIDQYYKFVKDFNKNYDPRVFQSVYLDPESKKKMLATLGPRELNEFRRKFNYAVEHHWIPDPREAQ